MASCGAAILSQIWPPTSEQLSLVSPTFSVWVQVDERLEAAAALCIYLNLDAEPSELPGNTPSPFPQHDSVTTTITSRFMAHLNGVSWPEVLLMPLVSSRRTSLWLDLLVVTFMSHRSCLGTFQRFAGCKTSVYYWKQTLCVQSLAKLFTFYVDHFMRQSNGDEAITGGKMSHSFLHVSLKKTLKCVVCIYFFPSPSESEFCRTSSCWRISENIRFKVFPQILTCTLTRPH